MNKLLIFDLDGTLVDCKELHHISFRYAVYKEYPGAIFTDKEVEGLSTIEKIKYLRNKNILVSDNIDIIKKNYTNEFIDHYVKYNPALYQVMNRLKDRYKMALCSNSRKEFIDKCLLVLNLQFDLIYHRESGIPKPDPWMFIDCMEKLNIDKKQTTIFEDSDVGLIAARASGADVVPINNCAYLLERLNDY